MNSTTLYAVKGTRYEPGEVYPELGEVRTSFIGLASGNEEAILRNYSGRGYMDVTVEPIEVDRSAGRLGRREVRHENFL